MATRPGRWFALAAAATLIMLSSGCQAAEQSGFGDGGATICMDRAPGEEVALGDVFSIPAGGRLVIEDVEVEQTGVAISGLFALPPDADGEMIGAVDLPLDPELWAQRTPLEGAAFEGEQAVSALIVASRTGDAEGTISGIRLAYTIDGQLYADTSATSFRISDDCD